MSKPFDATLKELVRRYISGYQEVFQLNGPSPSRLINVDLSTVSAATDIVLAHGEPLAALSTFDFQAGVDTHLDDRVLMYQSLLRHLYHVPVHSTVVLLYPGAYRPSMTGRVRYQTGQGRGKMNFGYELVRLWRMPVESLLVGPIGTLPLAPLAMIGNRHKRDRRLPGIIQEIDRRLFQELEPSQAADMMSATFVLTGLRVPKANLPELFRGVTRMEESAGYQIIFEKGEIRGQLKAARQSVLRLGEKRFGGVPPEVASAISRIKDLERLYRMEVRFFTAQKWDDILKTV